MAVEKEKILYLHIGHSKTGSSYLQSSFALSQGALSAHGITYPADSSISEAMAGRISSGNGFLLMDAMREDPGEDGMRLNQAISENDSIALSSEALFRFFIFPGKQLRQKKFLGWGAHSPETRVDRLIEWAKKHGFCRIEMLLLIRNPIDHLISKYQQRIKRGGRTEDLQTFASRFSFPEKVERGIRLFHSCDFISLTVRNYSYVAEDLTSVASGWLGLDRNVFTYPSTTSVNRSLTRSELALQIALNSELGKRGHLLSDVLCNELPDVPPDPLRLPLSLQNEIWEKNLPYIEKVNALIDEKEAYRLDIREPAGEKEELFFFTAEQIKLIGNRLGVEIRKLRENLAKQEAS